MGDWPMKLFTGIIYLSAIVFSVEGVVIVLRKEENVIYVFDRVLSKSNLTLSFHLPFLMKDNKGSL